MSSAAVSARARYSASVEERDTVGWRFADQEIILHPRNVQNPVVDLLVVFFSCPVTITEGLNIELAVFVNIQPMKDGAFNIAKDTLQEIKISECRLMHSLTDNVHGITYVWSSES